MLILYLIEMKIRRLFILIALLVGTLVQSFAISTPVNAAAHLLGNYLCADGTTFVAEECPPRSYDAAGASSAGVILIPKGSTCYDINGINTMPCDYDMRNDVGKFGELVFSKYENDYKAKHGRLPTPSELVSFINEIAFAQLDNNNPTDDWENKDCSKLSGVDNIQCVAIQKCIKDGVGNQTQCVSAWENCIGTADDPAHPTEAEAKACAEKVSTTGGGDEEPETCVIDGVGWIICPIVTFMSNVTDGAYTMAKKLLVFQVTEPWSTDPAKNPIYALWSTIRNVANLLFVIAFFIVIFSQATNFGISAYGIRKMLPRIIVAAILVNLSYYACIFAIDISNIIGGSLDGMIKSLPAGAAPANTEGNTWASLSSNVLIGSASIGLTAVLAIFATGTVFAFLAFSILAIMTAVAIFLARHVLLIMLIILSPLAFAAYILPNTENLFDKWRKAFIAMLVMYPLVAVLFAGSQVASQVMRMTADQTGGDLAWLYKLFSLAVLAIPLFGIPWIVKFSGGFIGRIAGMVNDRSKGFVDRARNRGNEAAYNNRARSTDLGKRWKKAGYGENGEALDGAGNKLRRFRGKTMGRGALWAGNHKTVKEWGKANRKREADRIQSHALNESLNEQEEKEDGTMGYTKRAEKLAQSATGGVRGTSIGSLGGEEAIRRVQNVALQEHIKHLAEERGQASLSMEANGMYGKGTYFEYGDDGRIVASHTNTGLALAAIAQGKKVGVIAAGVQAFDENGKVNMSKIKAFDGSDKGTANAAKERIAKTGDGAAFGYVMHGGADSSAVEVTADGKRGKTITHTLQALQDKDYDDFMQFAGDNAGATIGKIPHLYKSDDAFTGVNAEQIADWHGTELRSAASRIVQLREKAEQARLAGDAVMAKRYEDKATSHEGAMIRAWNDFQNDPQLAGKRSVKKETDFQSALDIIRGQDSSGKIVTRKALREYGDSVDASGQLAGSRAGGTRDQLALEVEFASQKPKSGTAEIHPNEKLSEAGIIIPRGTTSATQPRTAPTTTQAPAGPTPKTSSQSSRTQPATSSSGTVGEAASVAAQRQAGGNFGGFNYEPPAPARPDSSMAGQIGYDYLGRATPLKSDGTPMTNDEADTYHSRFGGGA